MGAYGWPRDLSDEQVLENLVALNRERAEEERKGLVRWLRPEFQNPTGKTSATQTSIADDDAATDETAVPVAATATPWPKKLPEQISAIRDLTTRGASEWTVDQVIAAFKGAKKKDAEDVLDSLAALGLLVKYDSNNTRTWRNARG